MRRRSSYLAWLKDLLVKSEYSSTSDRVRFDLSGSGVPKKKLSDLPLTVKKIKINDFNLYGYRPLLEKIANHYGVEWRNVVTTQGVSMANYLVFATLTNDKKEVLIETPTYEPIVAAAEFCGAKVKRFQRRFRNGYCLEQREIVNKINRHTALIVLTNLHNPSGIYIPSEDLTQIGELARHFGASVLVDEVYLDSLIDANSVSAVHLGGNFIVTSSLTKVYGFDGLRAGWIVCDSKLAERIWRIHDLICNNGVVLAEKLSTIVFKNINKYRKITIQLIENNLPLLAEFFDGQQTVEWIKPNGGTICFPKLVSSRKVKQLIQTLENDYSVRVTDGGFFGAPNHIRIGFGVPTTILREALRRISQAIE